MAEKTEVGKRAALFEQEVLDSLADVDGAFTVVLPGFGGQRILALGEQLSRYYDALAQAGRTAVRALVVSDATPGTIMHGNPTSTVYLTSMPAPAEAPGMATQEVAPVPTEPDVQD